ncbi:sigma-54-dependent Fis family transcriptional regulator [Aminithiophilus ramosus]|uniref:Sigma-54-dependent Fis family transcriptional regulator n=2 Tax=Synergistales TaxID=649776 RepID=A0A9Q7ALR8_9BACT|nr:sigma-54 dependent transcriptional regulator [Aminithiophilus ramosus]QTX31352.1 sigma-54-dependent Fis family transcriptional regulator [Aminithiophilus ramosus]QVL35151.1 sigma-54-dependent Fis family transcriptional regulator [Synergistota bacterium]
MTRLWIIEDEPSLAQGLGKAFEREGLAVTLIPDLAVLNRLLKGERPEIVLLDLRLPDGDGLTALPHLLKSNKEARVIVMTAFGDSALIVRAIKEGAYNYLDKPFPLEAARNMIRRAAEALDLSRRVSRLQGEGIPLVGTSPAMEKVRDFIAKVASFSDLNILIRGESGSGKEVVARLIHRNGARKGDFVALNCAAIPEALMEAELFGYRRGAYTGAAQDKTGLIEVARGGTLFLDEIGDMALPLQGKLLRFLDSRSFRPLGDTKETEVSLQVLCATCVDLESRIAQGTFRRDLFYRIALLPLELPPLRERGRDVLELLETFLAEFSARLGRPPLAPSAEVEELFLDYPWPGNVRELRNLVERLYILKESGDRAIRLADLPEEMLDALPPGSPFPSTAGNLKSRLDGYERNLLEEALAQCGSNRTRAAQLLGISRYALLRRMQRHGMD